MNNINAVKITINPINSINPKQNIFQNRIMIQNVGKVILKNIQLKINDEEFIEIMDMTRIGNIITLPKFIVDMGGLRPGNRHTFVYITNTPHPTIETIMVF